MKKQAEISSFGLKLVAILTMLIDHLTAGGVILSGSSVQYMIGRGIGRIAFPLFSFMLVEGYYHSKNRMSYLARLLALAFLSEVPFDMVFSGVYFNMGYQNVFFTLAIGLSAIMILGEIDRRVLEKMKGEDNEFKKRYFKFLNIILQLTVLVFMTSMAEILRTDYSANGVLLIVMIYFFEKFHAVFQDSNKRYGVQKVKNMLAAFGIFLWFFFYDMKGGGVNEMFGFPVVMLVYFYSGKKGSYAIPQWFFYAFYPLHLFLVVWLRRMSYGM